MDGIRYDPNEKIKYYSSICSNVIPNFLFVSGEQIAMNLEKLQELGITHIINCAGDICPNKFSEIINYRNYYLKDSKT